MTDREQTREQLVEELEQLRLRVAELEEQQEESRASDHMLRSIVRAVPDIIYRLDAGGKTEKEKSGAGVEKFLYMLEGEITVRIEKREMTLRKGETLYFEASLPHQIANPSSKKATVFCAVSPPSL